MTGNNFKIGDNCNWKNQPERLIYLGFNYSGNGYWHQFAKIDNPKVVWCEVLPEDLKMLEISIEKEALVLLCTAQTHPA